MKRVQVEIKGQSPILMHAFPMHPIEGLEKMPAEERNNPMIAGIATGYLRALRHERDQLVRRALGIATGHLRALRHHRALKLRPGPPEAHTARYRPCG